jgi:hypothetical protein
MDAIHINATDLLEIMLQTQLGQSIQYRIKLLTELIGRVVGPGLEFDEPAYKDLYMELACIFVRIEPEPIDGLHIYYWTNIV